MKTWKTILAAAALALAGSSAAFAARTDLVLGIVAGAAASRPDRGRGRGDRRGRLRQHLRRPDPDRLAWRGAAGAGRELDDLRRRQDLYVQAAHRREIPRRRRLQRRRREVLARPRARREFDQRAERPVRGDRHGRGRRPGHRQGDAEEPARLLPLQYGLGRRGDRRAGKRRRQQGKAGRHRPVQVRPLGQGLRRSPSSRTDGLLGRAGLPRQGRVPHRAGRRGRRSGAACPATSRPSPTSRPATRCRRSRPIRASRW